MILPLSRRQSRLSLFSGDSDLLNVSDERHPKRRIWLRPGKRLCILMIDVITGSFFSAAFENACATVQGASGGVFGMIGLFIGDLILNFETVKR